MQNGVQVIRRKFVTRLTVLATSSIALTTIAGVLTGCGGGGGGGISSPTPVPSTPPTLPDLATITPQTPTQAAATFQSEFGIPTTVGGTAGAPVTDATQSLTQLITLDTLLIPTYTTGPDGAPTGVTLQPAGEVTDILPASDVSSKAVFPTGLTVTDLRNIISTLATATEYVQLPGSHSLTRVPVIRRGDVPVFVNFTVNGKIFKTIAFRHTDGTLGFNFVLSAQPGKSETRSVPSNQDQTNRLANGGSTVETVVTNRNPYDGHVHYEFVLSAQAAFSRQNGVGTVTKPVAKVEILGPFVSATQPTVPTITNAAPSGVGRTPSHLVQSKATFTFRYARHVVWRIAELIKLLINNKTVTGSTGGSG